MSVFEFLILLIVAGVCGGLAQQLAGYSHGGCLVSVLLGFIGAMIGTWIARQLALPEFLELTIGGRQFPIIWSILGAALFAAILALLTGRARRRVP